MNEPSKLVFSPTDFIAITNQVFDTAFGFSYIEGEISNFRISKNKWVYFNLKDEFSKLQCFGSVYYLPGPIKDGMKVVVGGKPSLHNSYGFSLNFQSVTPSGQGTIKKAFDLLKAKLENEGLFDLSRKRRLPYPPTKVALVTSVESAAYADFIKVLSSRWPFVAIEVYDCLVQGENAPAQIAGSINASNQQSELPDVLIITRGGGSADDLAAFNDERVVRAIAASRVPTLVAIGHEIDESLSELVADLRASTPSNAAELIAPDRASELVFIKSVDSNLLSYYKQHLDYARSDLYNAKKYIHNRLRETLEKDKAFLSNAKILLQTLNPGEVLKKGYSLVFKQGSNQPISSTATVRVYDQLIIKLSDGRVKAQVKEVKND